MNDIVTVDIANGAAKSTFHPVSMTLDLGTGSVTLPPKMVKELGLKVIGQRSYSLHGKFIRADVVGPLRVRVGKRDTLIDAIVRRGKPRFGYIPFSAMDLVLSGEHDDAGNAILLPKEPGVITAIVMHV